MEIVQMKLADITMYEMNAKLHPKDQIEQIVKSIKEFGFNDPIAIDENNVIIEGHGRYLACKKLKMDEVPIIKLSHLSEPQKKAYILAHNKLTLNSGFDTGLLGLEFDFLKEIDDFDLSLTGFGPLEITSISAAMYKKDYNEDHDVVPLSERYIVPPFSVLDGKQGYWLDKKGWWNDKIRDNGSSRNTTQGKGVFAISISLIDPVLCELMNKWYLPKEEGNSICDCFSGDTGMGFVTDYVGNTFTGIELRQEQVDFNNEHTGDNAKYICDDGRNILNHIKEDSQDMLFSCPPYFDLEIYSDKENDASNQKNYAEFYQILDTAFTNAIKCLKNNRFAVIVAGDVRDKKTGEYYDFLGSIKETFKNNGLCLYNELILLTPLTSAPTRAHIFGKTRKNIKVHQNVLVFYKGDPTKIKTHFYNMEEAYNESTNV